MGKVKHSGKKEAIIGSFSSVLFHDLFSLLYFLSFFREFYRMMKLIIDNQLFKTE